MLSSHKRQRNTAYPEIRNSKFDTLDPPPLRTQREWTLCKDLVSKRGCRPAQLRARHRISPQPPSETLPKSAISNFKTFKSPVFTCVKTQKRKRLQRRSAEAEEMAAVLSERAAASAAVKHHARPILAAHVRSEAYSDVRHRHHSQREPDRRVVGQPPVETLRSWSPP